MYEYSRSEYLKALLNQKKTLNANSNSLVNPATPQADNIADLAALDTSFSGTSSTPVPENTDVEGTDRNLWQRTIDTAREFASNIGEGVLGFVDGLLDAGGYIYGAISGDQEGALGFMNYDWESQAMNVINRLDVVGNMMTGDIFTENYWNSWDTVGSSEASRNELNTLHENSLTKEWFGESGQQTYNQITQGIGSALPSIVLGIVTAGGSTALTALATATTATSAFGNSATDALNDGASYGEAALYGGISAGVEILTEQIGGIKFGKSTSKVISEASQEGFKAIAKETVKNMASEGFEELISELADPLARAATYKGAEALEEYGSEELYISSLISFASGALGGGVGGAVQTKAMNVKYTKEGVKALKEFAHANDLQNEFNQRVAAGNSNGQIDVTALSQEYGVKYSQAIESGLKSLKTLKEGNPKAFKKIVNEMYGIKDTSTTEESTYNEAITSLESSLNETMTQRYVRDIGSRIGVDLNLVEDSALQSAEAFMKATGIQLTADEQAQFSDPDSINDGLNIDGKVYISNKYQNDINQLIMHEAVSHGYLDSNQDLRDSFLNSLRINKEFRAKLKNISADVYKLYGLNQQQVQRIFDTKDINTKVISGETMSSETMAKFMEFLYSNNDISSVLNTLNKSKLSSMLSRAIRYLGTKGDATKQARLQLEKILSQIKSDNKKSARVTTKTTTVTKFSLSEKQKDILYPNLRKLSGIKLKADGTELTIKITKDTLTKNSDPYNTKNTYESIDYLVENSNDLREAISKATFLGYHKSTKQKKNVDGYYKFESTLNGVKIEFNVEKRANGDCVLYNIDVLYKKKKRTSNASTNVAPTGNNNVPDRSSSNSNITQENENGKKKTKFSKETKKMDKPSENNYNETTGDNYDNEFRRIQETSRGMSTEEIQLYRSGRKTLDEGLRRRLSNSVKGILMESDSNGTSNANGVLELTAKGNTFKIHQNVESEIFHDVFEIARNYLRFGELVDLHPVTSDEWNTGYKDCTCYLSEDGLSGFAITNKGDLISVFNASGKSGFLRAIAPVVKEKALTLDCFASINQDLETIYESIFNFTTASIMDYNMEYDHDDIAKNHQMPQVAFMVNANKVAGVELQHFNKDQYDEAQEHQLSYTKNIKFAKTKKNTDLDLEAQLEKEIEDMEFDYLDQLLFDDYFVKDKTLSTYTPETNLFNEGLSKDYFNEYGEFLEEAIEDTTYAQAFKDLISLNFWKTGETDKYYVDNYSFERFEEFVEAKLKSVGAYTFENFERIIKNYKRKLESQLAALRKRDTNKGFRSPSFLPKNVKTLLDTYELRESGKMAMYSVERVNKLIDYNKSDYNEDYAQAFTTMISPQEFLELTLPNAEEWFQRDVKPLDLEEIRQQTHRNADNIHLTVDMKTGEVLDHEGRHRMYALMKEGYTNVQILLLPRNIDRSQANKIKAPSQLKAQTFRYDEGRISSLRVNLTECIAMCEANRDLLTSASENAPTSTIKFAKVKKTSTTSTTTQTQQTTTKAKSAVYSDFFNVDGTINADWVKKGARGNYGNMIDLKDSRFIVDVALDTISRNLGVSADVNIDEINVVSRKFFEQYNVSDGAILRSKAYDTLLDSLLNANITMTQTGQTIKLKDFLVNNVALTGYASVEQFKTEMTSLIDGMIKAYGTPTKMQLAYNKFNAKVKAVTERLEEYVKAKIENTRLTYETAKLADDLQKYYDDHKVKSHLGVLVPELTYIRDLARGIKPNKKSKTVSAASIDNIVKHFDQIKYEKGSETLEALGLEFRQDWYDMYQYFKSKQTLDKKTGKLRFPKRALTLEETRVINTFLNNLHKKINDYIKGRELEIRQSFSKATTNINVVLNRTDPNARGAGFFKRELNYVTSPDIMLREMFGFNSEIVKICFDDMLDAYIKQQGVAQKFWDEYTKLAEPLSGKNKLARRQKMTWNGTEYNVENDVLVDIYLQSLATENRQALIDYGYTFDYNGKRRITIKFTDQMLLELENKLSPELKEFAKNVSDYYNNELKTYAKAHGIEVLDNAVYYPRNRSDIANRQVDSIMQQFRAMNPDTLPINQQRTNSKKALGGMGASVRIKGYINQVTKIGEMTETLDRYNKFLNTKVKDQNGNLVSRNELIKHINSDWEIWRAYIENQTVGLPVSKDVKGNKMFENLMAYTLGANISSVLKQTASIPTIMTEVHFSSFLKGMSGIKNIARYRTIKKTLMEQSPLLYKRLSKGHEILAQGFTEQLNKFSEATMIPMEKMDEAIIVTFCYQTAYYEAQFELKGTNPTEAQLQERTIKILERIVLNTQSNSVAPKMSMARSGAAGYVRKVLSYFTSDLNNMINICREIHSARGVAVKNVKSIEAMIAQTQQELDNHLPTIPNDVQDQIDKLKANIPNLKGDARKEAKRKLAELEGMQNKKADLELELENLRKLLEENKAHVNLGDKAKEIVKLIFVMALKGLTVASIGQLVDRLYGRKGWDENTLDDFVKDFVLESTVYNAPYFQTIFNSLQYDEPVGGFDFTLINEAIDTVKNLNEQLQSGDVNGWNLAYTFANLAGMMSGIPTKNIYNIFMGVWKNTDPSGHQADAIVKNYSDTYILQQYKEASSVGRTYQAKGYYQLLMKSYKVSTYSDKVQNETISLMNAGYNCLPKNFMLGYTTEDGQQVKFTNEQLDIFRTEYNKSNLAVEKLLDVTEYKSLTQEEKAEQIKKIYDLYYDYAKAKTMKNVPQNKMVKLLLYTGGKGNVEKYTILLSKISEIKESETKTRKELVFDYVNKLEGYTKEEKLLILHLAGYKMSGDNQTSLTKYLKRTGMKDKDIVEFLDIKGEENKDEKDSKSKNLLKKHKQ